MKKTASIILAIALFLGLAPLASFMDWNLSNNTALVAHAAQFSYPAYFEVTKAKSGVVTNSGNPAAICHTEPNGSSSGAKIAVGSLLTVVAETKNSSGNTWYKIKKTKDDGTVYYRWIWDAYVSYRGSIKSVSNVKYVIVNPDGAKVHNKPYSTKNPKTTVAKGKTITVTQEIKNYKNNVWYKYSGGFISQYSSNDVLQVKKHTSCTWNSGSVTKKATCTAKGSRKLTCTVCGKTKTEAIPALGHTYTSKYGYCTRCKKCTFETPKEVSYKYTVKKDAVVHEAPYGASPQIKSASKKKGDVINISQEIMNGEGNKWYKIPEGYIYSDYVYPGLFTTKLNLTKATISKGKTKTLTATVKGPSNTVTWLSSDKAIATVDSNGVVKGIKEGSCTITAKANGASAKCTVTVASITLSPTSATIQEGKIKTLKATPKGPSNTVTWSSSDKSIATVDKNGAVKGIKAGSCTITAKANGLSKKCAITVVNKAADDFKGLKLSVKNVETYVGSTIYITATTQKGYKPQSLSYSVSDKDMFTVSSGEMTADSLQSTTPNLNNNNNNNNSNKFKILIKNKGADNSGSGKIAFHSVYNKVEYEAICTFKIKSNNIYISEGSTFTPLFKKDGTSVTGTTYKKQYNVKENISISNGVFKAVNTGTMKVGYSNSLASGTFNITIVPKFTDSLINTSKNTTYQHELARFCADFCYLGYDVTNGKMTERLKKAGFDVTNISVNMTAKRDEVNYFIVKKSLGSKTLVFVGAIGSYHDQWYSNFDPKGQSPDRKATGKPSSTVHTGFNDARNYVDSKLKAYLKKNNLNENNTIFLFTGHSRGAATVNLLAAKYINDSKYPNSNIFAYAFATPNVAEIKDGTNSKYNCIFNILNPEDFVTHVMLEKWGYSRYGKSYVLPSRTNCTNYDTYYKKVNSIHKKYYHPQGSDYDNYTFGEEGTYIIIAKMGIAFPTMDSLYDTTRHLYRYNKGAPIFLSGYDMFRRTILPVVAKDATLIDYDFLVGGLLNDMGIYGDIIRYFVNPDADVEDFRSMSLKELTEIAGGRFAKAHGMETYCSFMKALSASEIKVENRKSDFDWAAIEPISHKNK